MPSAHSVKLRPLEREDLRYVHQLDNNASVMRYFLIISPEYQGKGLATRAAKLAMDYGFTVLNLYKLYLIVDKENEKAIHIYRKLGFTVEGELMHEFFINGQYRNAIRMCIFQHQYLAEHKTPGQTLLKPTAQ
ncbi:spermidine N1-acetyltransferase [Escherichia coli]|uniref:Spermidine N1-acetyltransferase n=1 Tax=Escherichia coli TaxID=562 RepID=A0A8S0FTS0_ECOLX|nr:spermidine N1-acetyltransferase [Escherichia coli]